MAAAPRHQDSHTNRDPWDSTSGSVGGCLAVLAAFGLSAVRLAGRAVGVLSRVGFFVVATCVTLAFKGEEQTTQPTVGGVSPGAVAGPVAILDDKAHTLVFPEGDRLRDIVWMFDGGPYTVPEVVRVVTSEAAYRVIA